MCGYANVRMIYGLINHLRVNTFTYMDVIFYCFVNFNKF